MSLKYIIYNKKWGPLFQYTTVPRINLSLFSFCSNYSQELLDKNKYLDANNNNDEMIRLLEVLSGNVNTIQKVTTLIF